MVYKRNVCPTCNQDVTEVERPLYDRQRRAISYSDETVVLTVTENAIFELLYDNYPKHCTNKAIEWHVWKSLDIDTKNNLSQHIYNMRSKLSAVGITIENIFSGGNNNGGYWLEW